VRFHRLFFIAMFLAVFIALQGIQFSTPADAKKDPKVLHLLSRGIWIEAIDGGRQILQEEWNAGGL
jgi:hypothetical protein